MEFFGPLFALILVAGLYFLIYSAIYQSKMKSDKKRIEDNQKQAKEEFYRQSQKQIVSRLISHIDDAIGEEFIKYEVVYKLRQETLKQLETSYQESPQDLIDFSNSINRQLWALKWVAHITYEEIGTGRHHLQDYLKPEGQILAQLNRLCLQKAFNHKYIDEDEYKQALKDLDDLIREVGTWA
jgi:hypothetical protein